MTTPPKKPKPAAVPPPSLEDKPRLKIEIPATRNIKSIATRSELTTIPENTEEGVFNVGDLVWVKLSGYPLWPAMISIDPVEKIHTKRAGNSKLGNVYHVQYFGEKPARNWTTLNSVTLFEGPDIATPQKGKKGQSIPKSRTKGLELAIAEAVQALTWDSESRVKKLTYEYVLVDDTSFVKPTPTKKRRLLIKRKSEISSDNVYDFDESIDEIEQNDQPVMVWSRPRVEEPDLDSDLDMGTPGSPLINSSSSNLNLNSKSKTAPKTKTLKIKLIKTESPRNRQAHKNTESTPTTRRTSKSKAAEQDKEPLADEVEEQIETSLNQ